MSQITGQVSHIQYCNGYRHTAADSNLVVSAVLALHKNNCNFTLDSNVIFVLVGIVVLVVVFFAIAFWIIATSQLFEVTTQYH